ncbi:MAG: bifunctional diguanylate cyclase/phosphodiesterase, partial [Alphaproteobacteria bacterium]
GHVAGDEFLIALASRLKGLLQSGECLARFNSDEFAVLLERTRDIQDAVALASRIHQALQMPFSMGGERVYATVSIGISTTAISAGGSEDVIRDADFAMHRAKLLGKARTEIYRSAVHHQARSQFQLEADLRQALETNRLELHYQPILELASQSLVGFEALARWPHERRGYISPADFIPLAEQAGLIVPLGRWALRAACAQAQAWRRELGPAADGLQMSVNVSGIQLNRDDIAATVRRALRDSGLDGQLLRLEVTESAFVDNPDAAASTLHELKALNLKLALDDFGTGYSSLSYLQRLPFDIIKIDRSFVRDIQEEGENYRLVEIISMLAQRLNIDVVAEGIETPEQALLIQNLGCRYGQGYYFSRPLTASQAANFITSQRSPAPAAATQGH